MEVKLTKADRIILKNMAYDSRILEKKLAQKCTLSKDSIRYRINRLEKLGVILGYSNFVDHKLLGYKSFKLYIKLSATLGQKKELVNFLSAQEQVFSIFESHGTWDLAVALFTKTNQEYYDFENKFLSEFGEIINNKSFCMMLDAVILNNRIIYDDEVRVFSLWKEDQLEEIDDKDKKLINELNKNSRESLVSLATKVKLSVDAVSKRVKKLTKKKIIARHTTNIDYNLLGFEKYKLFLYTKNYSQETEDKLFEFLKRIKNTVNIIRILGPWKLEVEFLIEKHQEFEEVVSEIQESFAENIQRLEYSIFRNETYFMGV